MGYESDQKPSDISGMPRLYYDRSRPFTKQVKFYDTYTAGLNIKNPKPISFPKVGLTS